MKRLGLLVMFLLVGCGGLAGEPVPTAPNQTPEVSLPVTIPTPPRIVITPTVTRKVACGELVEVDDQSSRFNIDQGALITILTDLGMCQRYLRFELRDRDDVTLTIWGGRFRNPSGWYTRVITITFPSPAFYEKPCVNCVCQYRTDYNQQMNCHLLGFIRGIWQEFQVTGNGSLFRTLVEEQIDEEEYATQMGLRGIVVAVRE